MFFIANSRTWSAGAYLPNRRGGQEGPTRHRSSLRSPRIRDSWEFVAGRTDRADLIKTDIVNISQMNACAVEYERSALDQPVRPDADDHHLALGQIVGQRADRPLDSRGHPRHRFEHLIRRA